VFQLLLFCFADNQKLLYTSGAWLPVGEVTFFVELEDESARTPGGAAARADPARKTPQYKVLRCGTGHVATRITEALAHLFQLLVVVLCSKEITRFDSSFSPTEPGHAWLGLAHACAHPHVAMVEHYSSCWLSMV
jgi:hypothetical protein